MASRISEKSALEFAIAKGEKESMSILSKGRAQAAEIIEKGRQELALEKARLTDELRKEISAISLMASEKILQKTIDAKSHKDLVDGVIKELESGKVKL